MPKFEGLLGGEHPLGRSFIELRAGEPPATINVFPSPGTYKHPLWGDIEVTEAGNQEFVENFNGQVYQEHVPIDAEHETKLSGAVGYLKKLAMNDDGSIEATVEWTERGTKLIEDDSYKYISPEWFEQWTDPATSKEYTNVLVGAALTTRPFFKGLRSLVASEGRWFDQDERGRTPLIRSTAEGISYNDLQTVVMSAARHTYPGIFGGSFGGWVSDLWDEYAVICGSDGSTYYKLEYSYNAGEITFAGQPREVHQRTVWEDAPMHASDKEDAKGDTTTTLSRTTTKPKEASMTTVIKTADEVDVSKLDQKERDTLFKKLGRAIFGHEEGEPPETPPPADPPTTTEEPPADPPSTEEPPPATDESAAPQTAAEITSLRGALSTEKQARIAAEKRLSGLEAVERERRYRDIILGRDETSVRAAQESNVPVRPMVGSHAAKLALMQSLAKACGEDSTEFTSYVAMERENASRLHEAGTFSEIGTDAGDLSERSPIKEFDRRVEAMIAKEPTLKQDEAIIRLASEDPKLYDAYDRAVSGRRGSHVGSGS